MYNERFINKSDVLSVFMNFPSFKDGVAQISSELSLIEKEHGVFNAVVQVSGREGADLIFKREDIVLQEIETGNGSVPVFTYAMVGYDLLDSGKFVFFNKTNANSVKYAILKGETVFSSDRLYESLNDEETRVLKRQRAARHGALSDGEELTSEVLYAIENGYLDSFIQENTSDVLDWIENDNPYYYEENTVLMDSIEEITSILEVLRAEDNSMSSKSSIEDYLVLDSEFDGYRGGKSSYNTSEGVVGLIRHDMLDSVQKNKNWSRRALFNAIKYDNHQFNAIALRYYHKNEAELFSLAAKGVLNRTPVMDSVMGLLMQKERAEAEIEEFRLNLLSIAQNISFEQELIEEEQEMARLWVMGVSMDFITAKQYAEFLERRGSQ